MTQVSLAVFVHVNLHSLLISRGYDLLIARNTATIRHFKTKLEQINASAKACGEDSSDFLQELKKSPYFRGAKVLSTNATREAIRFNEDEGVFSLYLKCLPSDAQSIQVDLNTRWFSTLFTDRSGLGDSGETYFISAKGILLTESRFLVAPPPAPIPANYIDQWAGRKLDYRGIPVLAVWNSVAYLGVNGTIASEIDVAEVISPAQRMTVYLWLFLAASSVVSFIFARLLAKNLSWRTEELTAIQSARNIALIEGQEQERIRIGLDLHDDIGQEVAALSWRLNDGQEIDEVKLNAIRRIADKVRALSNGLLTSVASADGLESSLRQLMTECRDQAAAQNLSLELQIEVPANRIAKLDSDLKLGIFRIAQEGLSNILKHSDAKTGRIHLNLQGEEDLTLIIEDDGKGFSNETQNSSRNHPAIGLHSMQIRAEALKGTLHVQSSSHFGGARIEAHFNIKDTTS